jgi:hypothetical protein
MKTYLPNRASVLLAVAAVFFALGHVADGSGTQGFSEAFGPPKNLKAGGIAVSTATCPVGTEAVSGGWAFTRTTNDLVATYNSSPTHQLRGWSTLEEDYNPTDGDGRGRGFGFAICGP